MALVEDLLWAHADPDLDLEHIRVRRARNGLEIVALMGGTSGARALHGARSLLDRAHDALVAQGYTVATLSSD
ncbi:hypothetical protein M8Z33_13670 [Streptomyces sp. ZAF1911]|uniref:hypothetical protein n=1 Tax=Streptomyces sp. ZAF1911 TaxID=2944129 RepID=UPI00237BA9CE|nr:hypothetical protein [Streptomyces sp. ZAF1911]MDD9377688.1 hypothetical protein [Streptomyces sp. ZAF1911]